MRVLIVGAGAVGQVYGFHLAQSGADVAVFVRERHVEACRRGLPLYPLGGRARRGSGVGRGESVRFTPNDVLTSASDVARQPWDQLWLCVPANALYETWPREIFDAAQGATIVLLTPGLEDRARVETLGGGERLVSGVITFLSYQTPLPGETRPEPGVAYWFPPMSPCPFDRASPRAAPIVAALKQGGCPAVLRDRPWEMSAAASAVLIPHLVALEASGWSLRALRRGPHAKPAALAAREAAAIAAAAQGRRVSGTQSVLLRPFFIRMVLALAPRFVPFDLDRYLGYHFTKVGEQTRFMVRTYIERGDSLGKPTRALRELSSLIDAPPKTQRLA